MTRAVDWSWEMEMAHFTVADVLAWARTKPADERYDYCDARECAVAQFGRETDRPHLIGIQWDGLQAIDMRLYKAVNVCPEEQTYGQLAQRLAAHFPGDAPTSKWTRLDAYLTDIETVAA